MSDILYDYGLQTGQDMFSDGWLIERIVPIGNDYYNVRMHQQGDAMSVDVLIDTANEEYKVLYVICDKNEHIADDEPGYMSQYEWKPYIWEDTSAKLRIPYPEIYPTSTYTVIEAALTAYEQETGYVGDWEIVEIYPDSPCMDYLLMSDDRLAWFCVDYSREYAVEIFYLENFAAADAFLYQN